MKLLSAKKRSIVPSLEHEIALFRKVINRLSTAIDRLTRLTPAKMFLILVPRLQTIQNDEMKTPSNSTMTTNQSLENILEAHHPISVGRCGMLHTTLVNLKDKSIGYQLPFR
ncbi:unnamed protein product [Prunus brigantina]